MQKHLIKEHRNQSLYLLICQPACQPACVCACLSVHLYVALNYQPVAAIRPSAYVCLSVYLFFCPFVWPPSCLPVCNLCISAACLPVELSACLYLVKCKTIKIFKLEHLSKRRIYWIQLLLKKLLSL